MSLFNEYFSKAMVYIVMVLAIMISISHKPNRRTEFSHDDVRWTRHFKAVLTLPFNILITAPILITFFGNNGENISLMKKNMLFSNTEWNRYSNFKLSIIAVITFIIGLAGLALLIQTNKLFHKAKGTLAPWDPPKKLVILGPYRYVRNPMLLGVNLVLIFEGILVGSYEILAFMICFVVVNTIYFIAKEEPILRERYGLEYDLYLLNVPRWLPRLTPYVQ